MDWITIICKVIIPVLGIILTAVVIPIFRERRQEELAASAVRAVEQMLGAGRGDEKYSLAEAMLMRAGVSDVDAARLIEAAVYELNKIEKSVAK